MASVVACDGDAVARGATVTVSCTCDLEQSEASSVTHAPMASDNKSRTRLVRPCFLLLSTSSCMSSPRSNVLGGASAPLRCTPASCPPVFLSFPFRRNSKGNVYASRWFENLPDLGNILAEPRPTGCGEPADARMCATDTTGFSRVVFQFRPSLSRIFFLRHHRLQP